MVNSKIQNLMVRRANEDESGFTLIELLIVMIIIGVLAAIAIPAFLNQQKGARDTQTTSDVRNAAIAVQTLVTKYPDADTFTLFAGANDQEKFVGATSGGTAIPAANREKITLSAGTELRIAGGTGAGNLDTFLVGGWNAKGKNFTEHGKARVYDSSKGGLQPNAIAAPGTAPTP